MDTRKLFSEHGNEVEATPGFDGRVELVIRNRRTWLMVKKDLERVGIPYETPEGIADFHAAGRHSHITGLMKSGATLPEAQKLARHTDIKMTMKYTHIGIDDQAKAVANLPALHGRCTLDGVARPEVSPSVAEPGPENEPTPDTIEGCVVPCHPVAQGDNMEAAGIEPVSLIRRRQLINPRVGFIVFP